MEQQKEPSLVPVLAMIGALLVAALLAALYYRSIEAQKARDREIAASLARQKGSMSFRVETNIHSGGRMDARWTG